MLHTSPTQKSALGLEKQHAALLKYKRILIVDDELILQKVLSRELGQQGFLTVETGNARSALAEVEREQFDLVITDLVMPGEDGLWLLEQVKSLYPETAVILLTGYGDVDTSIKAIQLGVDDYLVKPIDTDELFYRVMRCFEKQNLIRTLSEQNDRLQKEIQRREKLEQDLKGHCDNIQRFFYTVAHDLKVPAISAHGLIRRLTDKLGSRLTVDEQRCCDQITRNTGQIFNLVDHINTYIITRKSKLNIEQVRLKDIARKTREDFALQLKKRNIRWVEPEYLPVIQADKVALHRVLRNLVDNALKYGGEQLCQISIRYASFPGYHLLSVMNNGECIEEQDCDTIFELFTRKVQASETQGTGLGLAIVKEIIEQHGGRVWAEPDTPRGVIFHMKISSELVTNQPCESNRDISVSQQ